MSQVAKKPIWIPVSPRIRLGVNKQLVDNSLTHSRVGREYKPSFAELEKDNNNRFFFAKCHPATNPLCLHKNYLFGDICHKIVFYAGLSLNSGSVGEILSEFAFANTKILTYFWWHFLRICHTRNLARIWIFFLFANTNSRIIGYTSGPARE